MKVSLAARMKINEFLDGLNKAGSIDLATKLDLQTLLREPEPPRESCAGIRRDMWKQALARLGLTRGNVDKEQAMLGKLENLLIASHGFAVLFTLMALIPVCVMYWQYAWVAPVVMVLPLWHLYASRVLAGRLGDRDRADASHVKAGIFSIVPLSLIYVYCQGVFGIALPALSIPAAWLLYSLVLALTVRRHGAVKLCLWAGAIFINASPLLLKWSPTLPVLMAADGIVAMALLFMRRFAKNWGRVEEADSLRTTAGGLMFCSFIFAGAAWIHPETAGVPKHLSGTGIALVISLPIFLAALWSEVAGISSTGRKIHYAANLTAAYALLFYVAFAINPAVPRLHRGLRMELGDIVFWGWLYLIALSWSLWIVLGQIIDRRTHHDGLFELGSLGVAVCGIAMGWVLFSRGLWPVCLAMGIGLFVVVRGKLKLLETVKPSVQMNAADDYAGNAW